MRLQFISLEISGFKSFTAKESLKFPKADSGFFMMAGKNEVEPALGSNGAGKSSFWDAFGWVNFGKTARGMKAKTVANWGDENQCCVREVIAVDGEKYTIMRAWNPNALTLACGDQEPKTVVQEDIDALLQLNYTSFLYTLLMGQFNKFFFDLTASEKLQVFSEALELNAWLDASKMASDRMKECAKECASLDTSIASREGKQELYIEEIVDAKTKSKSFESERKEFIQATQTQIAEIKPDLEENESELRSLNSALKGIGDEHGELEQKFIKLDAERTEVRKKVTKHDTDIQVLQAQASILEKEMKKYEKIGIAKTCPHCGQKVTAAHIKNCTKELSHDANILNQGIAGIAKEKEEVEKIVDEIIGELEGLEACLDKLEKNSKKIRKETGELVSSVKNDRDSLALAERELETEKKKSNPYKAKVIELEEKLEQLQEKLVKQAKKRKAAQREKAAFEIWVKEFKALRLWIVEEALREFEVEVNNSLIELGLSEWEVKFAAERETISGTVSRGFQVMVKAPSAKEAVPWESWCGGETQRLRIAGAVGLANLIKSRRGVSCNIEAWDEPTAHLSEEGINDLLDFFAARSKREDRQIWLIDHRSLHYGEFDGRVDIVKDDKGSKIIPRF